MKLCLILITFSLLIACGQEQAPEQGAAGSINDIYALKQDDFITSDEKSLMSNICRALKAKTSHYTGNFAGQEGKTINISLDNSECGGDYKNLRPKEVTVSIVAERLFFSGDTHFTDVITDKSDLLNDLCTDLSTQEETLRYDQTGSVATFYYIKDGKDPKCKMTGGVCFYSLVGKAMENDTNKYKITDAITLKISTQVGTKRDGVVVARELATSNGCSDGENQKQLQLNEHFQ